jgi:hypothetical protein
MAALPPSRTHFFPLTTPYLLPPQELSFIPPTIPQFLARVIGSVAMVEPERSSCFFTQRRVAQFFSGLKATQCLIARVGLIDIVPLMIGGCVVELCDFHGCEMLTKCRLLKDSALDSHKAVERFVLEQTLDNFVEKALVKSDSLHAFRQAVKRSRFNVIDRFEETLEVNAADVGAEKSFIYYVNIADTLLGVDEPYIHCFAIEQYQKVDGNIGYRIYQSYQYKYTLHDCLFSKTIEYTTEQMAEFIQDFRTIFSKDRWDEDIGFIWEKWFFVRIDFSSNIPTHRSMMAWDFKSSNKAILKGVTFRYAVDTFNPKTILFGLFQ